MGGFAEFPLLWAMAANGKAVERAKRARREITVIFSPKIRNTVCFSLLRLGQQAKFVIAIVGYEVFT